MSAGQPVRTQPPFFERVRCSAAKRWDQLEADPELAGPWRQLFSQVQSPRHVVSELLQNADDAGATWARVRVSALEFVFEHNGEDFNEEQFASLCRFGYSNKRNLHTIGFRGVGFKATFSLGPEVRVETPSISLRFIADRFTEPIWLDGSGEIHHTRVSVKMDDENRFKEVQKNIDEWHRSPISLLFFRSITRLEFDDSVISRERVAPGPVPDSDWISLSGTTSQRLLLLRSPEESFPEAAIEEIRKERMSDDVDLPPCSIDVVLGFDGEQRLYVVLPTGVTPDLPFSCNAPFMQDPARTSIKDPGVSPTNRWLLGRVSRLIASSLSGWLTNEELSIDERAAAYAIMPWQTDDDGDNIHAAVTQKVISSFENRIINEPLLLCHDGALAETAFAPPAELYRVWGADELIRLFSQGEHESRLLTSTITEESRDCLEEWKLLRQIPPIRVIGRLKEIKPPRPKSFLALTELWLFVSDSVRGDHRGEARKQLSIIPVAGSDRLQPAQGVVRVNSSNQTLPREDWEFVSANLPVLDPGWLSHTDGLVEDGDKASISELMRLIGLTQATSPDRIAAIVAQDLFREEVSPQTAVRFTHILAGLDAAVPKDFKYFTRSGELRSTTDTVILDERGEVAQFLPPELALELVIAEAYDQEGSRYNWREWARSHKSKLTYSVPIQQRKDMVFSKDSVGDFVKSRHGSRPTHYPYVTENFTIVDYDFDERVVAMAEERVADDESAWAELLRGVITGPSSGWAERTAAKVIQVGRRYTPELDTGNCAAAWILRFQRLACLPDTFGKLRHPSELLMRTPDTEPLINVEAFVEADLDSEATKPLLLALGVRSTPDGADSILNRLRALAGNDGVPEHETAKWYEALDRLVLRMGSGDLADTRQIFLTESLIRTHEDDWVTSQEVFQGGSDLEVEGIPLVHPSVGQLALWTRLEVADRPSLEHILRWLSQLDPGTMLEGKRRGRVRAFLAQHPKSVWDHCKHWLNLENRWVPIDDVQYVLGRDAGVRVRDLFVTTRRAVADFRWLADDGGSSPSFHGLRDLGNLIRSVVNCEQSAGERTHRPWLVAFGDAMQRFACDDEADQTHVVEVASRLLKTAWVETNAFTVTPFLDGRPVGQAAEPNAVWDEDRLLVRSGSLARRIDDVVNEIARHFGPESVREALRMCAERASDFVTEYLEARFDLAEPEPLSPGIPSSESEAPAGGTAGDSVPRQPEGQDESNGDPRQTPDVAPGGQVVTDETAEASSTADQVHEVAATPETNEPFEMDVHDNETEEQHTPRKPAAPAKPKLIEQFASEQGFRKQPDGRTYSHPDGRVLTHERGLFPWIVTDVDGMVSARYLVMEHRLGTGFPIGADAWELLRKGTQPVSIVVQSDSGNPLPLSAEQLRDMVERDELQLFASEYRLRRPLWIEED